MSLAQWCGARKSVIVTSAWWALPVLPACCLAGAPWACLSLQPTRLLLFPAQCYVLLSKYICEKKICLYISLSAGLFHPLQWQGLGFGLRAVFSQSLSIRSAMYSCSSVLNLHDGIPFLYVFLCEYTVYEQIAVLKCRLWCSVKHFWTTLVKFLNLLNQTETQTETANSQLNQMGYFC